MDPERPIEKLLRAQAKKRREEAGTDFELHDATRKLLRDEAARTWGKTAPSSASRFFIIWPRLVWATAILAVLGIAVYMFIPIRSQPGDASLVQNRSVPADFSKQDLAPATASGLSQEPATALSSSDLLASQDKRPRLAGRSETDAAVPLSDQAGAVSASSIRSLEKNESAPRPALRIDQVGKPAEPQPQPLVARQQYGVEMAPSVSPVPSRPAVPAAAAGAPFFKQPQENGKLALAAAPAPESERPASEMALVTNAIVSNEALARDALPTIVQRYTQVQARGTKAKAQLSESLPATPVLTLFQVEQSGDQLRIVDKDGSVYSGRLVNQEVELNRLSETRSRSFVRAPATDQSFQGNAASAAQNFSFRVTGTNRSMNQRVVFTGNFTSATNSVLTTMTNPAPFGNVQNSAGFLNSLSNSRISGSAQIGKDKEIRIEAVPTP